ncbi:MAG TPA: PilZ domain-containing protein [Acidobacteriaceae bacterium]|nr:PilZ domain-containing protein [Acidobacteriaceae bacterium]
MGPRLMGGSGFADNPGMSQSRTVAVYRSTGQDGAPSDAEIVLPGRGLQYSGRIVYLSAEGCLIESKCRLEPGTTVELWMRTERMPLRLLAHLVERREAGVEFRFQEMSLRKLDQIESLTAELAAEEGAA